MGEEQCLFELRPVARCDAGAGDARERLEPAIGEGQGNQRGARLGQRMTEALGDVVGKPGRAHFRDRLAAGGQHQIARGDGLAPARPLEHRMKGAIRMREVHERGFEPQLRARPVHRAAQHGDDVLGAGVAEQLAQRLLMPGDAGLGHLGDEIPLRVARQGGFGEMRVLAEIAVELDVEIGEVAAPAPGDADLLARGLRMVDHQGARPGMGRAHHAGRAGPEDERVHLHAARKPRRAGFRKPRMRTGLPRCPAFGRLRENAPENKALESRKTDP